MKKIFLYASAILFFGCNNDSGNDNGGKDDSTAIPAVPINQLSIIKVYPHDTTSFTEGITIYNGKMYESTGEYGPSKLAEINLETGKEIRSVKLDKKYFGEGIAILHDTIYQFTYKEKKVFAYTLKDFKKIKEFDIDLAEGWGATTDGTYIIAGDGSSNLYYYNPSDFKLVKTLAVSEAGTLSYNINELEYVDGFIYANQWQQPYILKIDTKTGYIVSKTDITNIWQQEANKYANAEVPNGIAYDAATKKFYITGKNWPDLFEVVFSQ